MQLSFLSAELDATMIQCCPRFGIIVSRILALGSCSTPSAKSGRRGPYRFMIDTSSSTTNVIRSRPTLSGPEYVLRVAVSSCFSDIPNRIMWVNTAILGLASAKRDPACSRVVCSDKTALIRGCPSPKPHPPTLAGRLPTCNGTIAVRVLLQRISPKQMKTIDFLRRIGF